MFKILFSLGFILTTFLVSNYVFVPAYLYYEFPWTDSLMHIVGGFGFGLLVISFVLYKKQNISFKKIVYFVLVVAIAWEIYEYSVGAVAYDIPYDYFDTIKDLILDILGAWIAYKFLK